MTRDRVGRSTVITAASDVYSGVLDGRLVLFSGKDRRLHVLNDTAQAIWRDLGVGRTLRGLIGVVADEYDVDESSIAEDVETLVHTLSDAGLCHLSSDEVVRGGVPSRSSWSPRQHARVVPRLVPSGASIIGPIRALGVPVTVETDDALLRLDLARVFDSLRPQADDLEEPHLDASHQHVSITALEGRWVIRRNNVKVTTVTTRPAVIRAVVAECNSAPLAHIDDAVVLHAAGLDMGRGVVLFPGVSNAGKSTLAAQLLRRGCAYLSDEAVALELESLRARPYTKALALEPASQDLFPELIGGLDGSETLDVDPRTIGAGRLSSGGPVAAIVFPRFDPDANAQLVPLEPIAALRQLVANAFDFGHVGQGAFDALARAADLLPCYALTHRGGHEHLDQLEVMFGDAEAVSL